MELNENTEFMIGGFVLYKDDAIGIIIDKQENDDYDYPEERWGKYWYGIKWLKFKNNSCPSEGPWSLPDFKEKVVEYVGTNPKTIEVLYGYKQI